VYRWMEELKQDGTQAFPGSGKLKPDDQAIRDLQKQLLDQKEENEILKKSMHYFDVTLTIEQLFANIKYQQT
jgi:transposase